MPDDYDLNPIDYQPRFTEPFAVPTEPATPEQTARMHEAVKSMFLNTVGAPGVAAQPIVPETPGMLSDVDVAKQIATDERLKNWAPQQALNMVGQGAPMAVEGAAGIAGGKLPIRAYHGSSHDFERFDISKIGTGQGAQTYGRGLYFAEHPDVAKDYREGLSGGYEKHVGGEPYDSSRPEHLASSLVDTFAKRGDPASMAHNELVADIANPNLMPDRREIYQKAADIIASGQELLPVTKVPKGKMYEVAINANPEHFLDWDKPLSEQHPKVQRALGVEPRDFEAEQALFDKAKKLGVPPTSLPEYKQLEAAMDASSHKNETGASLMQRAHRNEMFAGDLIGKDRATSEELVKGLNEKGIPGIKYLDQGSRGDYKIFSKGGDQYGVLKPDGSEYPLSFSKEAAQAEVNKQNSYSKTSNYVVFDDKLIDIIKKYGLAGLVAGGAGHFATKAVDYDPFKDDAKHAKGGAVRLSHASVGYMAQSTHLPQKCGRCTMFIPPTGCTLVQSPIKAGGWCRRFEGK